MSGSYFYIRAESLQPLSKPMPQLLFMLAAMKPMLTKSNWLWIWRWRWQLLHLFLTKILHRFLLGPDTFLAGYPIPDIWLIIGYPGFCC